MKVEELIEELKKYSTENKKDDKKEIYIFEEKTFENYEVGVIINEYDNDIFEVYLYLKGMNKAVSKLMLKEFDNLSDAKKYYKELLDIAKQGNLDEIREKIIHQKKV